jgi:hypothetical protein
MFKPNFERVQYDDQTWTVHPECLTQFHDHVEKCIVTPEVVTGVSNHPSRECRRVGCWWVIVDEERGSIHATGSSPIASPYTLDYQADVSWDEQDNETFRIWYASEKQKTALVVKGGPKTDLMIKEALSDPQNVSVEDDGSWTYCHRNGMTVNIEPDEARIHHVEWPNGWVGGATTCELEARHLRNVHETVIRELVPFRAVSPLTDDQLARMYAITKES